MIMWGKRSHPVSSSDNSGEESDADLSRAGYHTDPRTCPHCSESLSLKNNRFQKRLHFDSVINSLLESLPYVRLSVSKQIEVGRMYSQSSAVN